MKDAASAILSFCTVHENKAKFIAMGAVKKINDGILVDELLGILAVLSTHKDTIFELGGLRTIRGLFRIIRNSSSKRAIENCAAILYNMYWKNRILLEMIKAEEIQEGTLTSARRLRAERQVMASLQDLVLLL
ncbi:U-box domain-containing protein 9 [Gossypium australe]|uniref:U-box domain-containing protein 9 n=1 Tax=Gossypium australe TaxID=47621 RepID=A0A5B6VVP9_9ROSI|nr:U-box domain-containing protein 9 [Gossypium australe]